MLTLHYAEAVGSEGGKCMDEMGTGSMSRSGICCCPRRSSTLVPSHRVPVLHPGLHQALTGSPVFPPTRTFTRRGTSTEEIPPMVVPLLVFHRPGLRTKMISFRRKLLEPSLLRGVYVGTVVIIWCCWCCHDLYLLFVFDFKT